MRLLLPALLLAACGDPAPIDPDASPPDAPPADDLAADLTAVRDAHGVPALAAAIGSRDQLIDIAAVGTRHRDTTVAVEPDDRFHLGSDTKAMTATLIAMAIDEGRLDWDTTLAELLPGIVDMHPDYAAVPIDALLAHRAGAWTDLLEHLDELAGIPDDALPRDQRRRFAEIMLAEPPELPPGTAYGYSNAGYMIAGTVLEELHDMPWEQLIEERLFAPLDMDSCGFGAPGTTALVDEPWGHAGEEMTPVPPDHPGSDNPPWLGPAGTVHCALPDWMQFARIQLGGGPRLVSDEALVRLHTSLGDDYALGWLVGDHPELGRWIGHDGSNTLWYARIVVFFDHDRALVIASNAASTAAVTAVEDAMVALIDRYLR
jgi:CubicO group peptidase (beta-lactamase class C family)